MFANRSLLFSWQHNTNHYPSPQSSNVLDINGIRLSGSGLDGIPPIPSSKKFRSASRSFTMSQHEARHHPPLFPTQTQVASSEPAHDVAIKLLHKYHQHNASDSSGSIGSNESSPTTTISTVDDSSATEPSPGSSPESPPPNTFSDGMLRQETADESQKPFFRLEAVAPNKKGRNLKGLAVNTSKPLGKASQSMTFLPVSMNLNPEVSIMSPAFVKPLTPKRKSNTLGLSIMTPTSQKAPPQQIKLAIPPTPGYARPATLRHFQSSPSLPVVPDIVFNSQRSFAAPTLETILSPSESEAKSLLVPQVEEEEEQNFDIPQSREEKPEAYPDGPICVFEPFIDLYLEPNAAQARQYDVIMNVASEVRNPLMVQTEPAPAQPELVMDGGGGIRHHQPKHLTTQDGSPTTPKATPLISKFPDTFAGPSQNDPEYVHIPWEHNSDIVPDLLRLVKFIDEKVEEGKRILIHCQCGVSRSASLVVAYALYKNPGMSVQEAYDMIKKRSKWIGPNMNLIMQLQEFRSSLARGGVILPNSALSPITPSSAVDNWRGPFSRAHGQNAGDNVPMSAVEPTRKEFTAESLPAVSPGPSSAPSGQPWPSAKPSYAQAASRSKAANVAKPVSAFVDPSGHVVPVLQVIEPELPQAKPTLTLEPSSELKDDSDSATPTDTMASSQVEEFAMAPLQPPRDVDPADAFGLMSPSSTECAMSPFDRPALLASLGMGSMRPQDDVPRRAVSLRSRGAGRSDGASLRPQHQVRGKISSPSLRERQQLHDLQAQIETQLSLEHRNKNASVVDGFDAPLKSPRATAFTHNPFEQMLSPDPPSTVLNDAVRPQGVDPRSPANTGISPITRNILDVL